MCFHSKNGFPNAPQRNILLHRLPCFRCAELPALTRNSYRPAADSEGLPHLSNIPSSGTPAAVSVTAKLGLLYHVCYMRVTLTLRQFLHYDATNHVRATFEITLTRHIQSVGARLAQPVNGLRTGWTARRIPVWTRFSAPVERGLGAHTASCTVQRVLDLFPGDKVVGLWRWPPVPSSPKVKED
jgi:hypothetical protein